MNTPSTATRRARAVLSMLLTALIMTLAACGIRPAKLEPQPKPQPKTEKIIYPATFVRRFCISKEEKTPEAVAQSFKNERPGYFTDVYATPRGNVVAVVTEQQRHANIGLDDDWIKKDNNLFTQNKPEYRYAINNDGTAMDVWTDNRLAISEGFGISDIPFHIGNKYYLEHGKGDWDMRITIYNCHTNQQVITFKASDGLNLNLKTLGD